MWGYRPRTGTWRPLPRQNRPDQRPVPGRDQPEGPGGPVRARPGRSGDRRAGGIGWPRRGWSPALKRIEGFARLLRRVFGQSMNKAKPRAGNGSGFLFMVAPLRSCLTATGAYPVEKWKAAYFAGLIDGDGSITLGHRSGKYMPLVSITNTDDKLIAAAMETFPGGVIRTRNRRTERWKAAHEARWRYRSALAILDHVLPFLICKREAAILVLSWRTLVRRNGKYTQEEAEAIAAIVPAIRAINKRGPK